MADSKENAAADTEGRIILEEPDLSQAAPGAQPPSPPPEVDSNAGEAEKQEKDSAAKKEGGKEDIAMDDFEAPGYSFEVIDDSDFTINNLIFGGLRLRLRLGPNATVTFRGLTGKEHEEIAKKLAEMGDRITVEYAELTRTFELLARSVVEINGNMIEGKLEDRLDAIKGLDDTLSDILSAAYREFQQRKSRLITEDSVKKS